MPVRERKRANLRDVAKAAGVSVATVSRVLNTPEVVLNETRLRVEKAIAELRFHPSAAARAINSGRTKIIGALIPSLDNDTFAITIESIENRLGDFGLSLVVATTAEDPKQELRRAQDLVNIGVEGLFLPGVNHSDALHELIERTGIPTVVISYFQPDFIYPTIGYDNQKASGLSLAHLIELGHRNVAVVHGPAASNDRTRERAKGVSTDCSDVTLEFFETELSVAGGSAVVSRLASTGESFDAFLCLSDILAFGVLFELQRQAVRVPNDVSIIGIHDVPASEAVFPRLSTVRLPAQQMGRKAAEAMAKWIEDGTRPESECFDSQLIQRETTAPRQS